MTFRMLKKIIALCCLSLSAVAALGQKLISPDHNLSITFRVSGEGVPVYDLTYKQREVLKPSRLGFELIGDGPLNTEFVLLDAKESTFDETWKPVWGEVSSIRNYYNELLVQLQQKTTGKKLNIRFRPINDGLGFRYEFPEQPNLKYFVLKEEDTEFALTGDHKAFWIPGDFDTEEYRTVTSKLSEVRQRMKDAVTSNVSQTTFSPTGVQTPLMLKSQDELYINIHEAALVITPR
jgi:glucan 1,4-alpha-glucosidase